MTTFQGQSAKRHSNKKNFKSGQNQRNAIFIFITFRNHRKKILTLFHIYKCRRFRKSNQKRAPELGIPTEWQHSKASRETSLKQEKLQKRSKSTKCYTHFHNFPESSAKNLTLFHIYKCRRFRKSNQKRAPELGIPTEWHISRSVGERSLKQEKLQKRSKSTKCYIHFHNFPESSAKNFNVVSHLQVSQIQKIKSK